MTPVGSRQKERIKLNHLSRFRPEEKPKPKRKTKETKSRTKSK